EETIVKKNKSIEFEENKKAMFEKNKNILEKNRKVILKFYISQSLTTNKKCALFFNINLVIKIILMAIPGKLLHAGLQNITIQVIKKIEFLLKSVERQICSSNSCSAKICMLHFVGTQKVQIEQYNNSFDYIHILEEIKVLKHSNAVQNLVKEEAVKNYSPPTIISTIKDYTTKKLDLDASVKKLK
ncbi:44737_t:CDS:2, partial [Gigaspora margarita]